MNVYAILVYLHVTSVILSIGPYFVMIPLIRLIKNSDSAVSDTTIQTFRYVIRLSKHAGHVLVITGLLLMVVGHWPWYTSWIVITVVILVGSLYFIARAFTPTLKQLRQSNADHPLLAAKLTQSLWIYLILMFIMLWLMVAKPSFW